MDKIIDFYSNLRSDLLIELRYEISQELEKQNTKLENRINELESKIVELETDKLKLETKNTELDNRITELESKRNENYYQRFLERKLSATHKRTKFGITDITTDKEHIEIKHWKNYKSALGQLLSYNHNDNKTLSVYFFGTIDDNQRRNIIELYSSKGVNINELVDTLDGIQIREVNKIEQQEEIEQCVSETEETEIHKFSKWLDENVEYKQGELLKLSEICDLYLDEAKIHTSVSTKIRQQIEQWIKNKYTNVKWNYGLVNINGISQNGWKNLCLKNSHNYKFLFVSKYIKKGGDGIKWSDLFIKYKNWYNNINGYNNSIDNIDKKELKLFFENKIFKKQEQPIRNIGRGWLRWSLIDT